MRLDINIQDKEIIKLQYQDIILQPFVVTTDNETTYYRALKLPCLDNPNCVNSNHRQTNSGTFIHVFIK